MISGAFKLYFFFLHSLARIDLFAMPPTRAYQPISSDPPSPLDLELDKSLKRYMDIHIPLESESNLEKRKTSLSFLRQIIREWIKFVAIEEFRMSSDDADMAGGEIFISGSYRLRIFEPGSDIDVLCVVSSPYFNDDVVF